MTVRAPPILKSVISTRVTHDLEIQTYHIAHSYPPYNQNHIAKLAGHGFHCSFRLQATTTTEAKWDKIWAKSTTTTGAKKNKDIAFFVSRFICNVGLMQANGITITKAS